nr:uncharacterized protein LOC108400111 [Manis javanica]
MRGHEIASKRVPGSTHTTSQQCQEHLSLSPGSLHRPRGCVRHTKADRKRQFKDDPFLIYCRGLELPIFLDEETSRKSRLGSSRRGSFLQGAPRCGVWWEVSFPEPQSLAAVPPPPALVSRVPSPLQTLQIWARASAPAPQVCARGAPNACWAPVGARQTRGARTGRGDTGTGPRAPAHPRPQPQRPLGRSDPPGRGAPEQPLSFPRPQEARVPFPTGSRGGPASFPALQGDPLLERGHEAATQQKRVDAAPNSRLH